MALKGFEGVDSRDSSTVGDVGHPLPWEIPSFQRHTSIPGVEPGHPRQETSQDRPRGLQTPHTQIPHDGGAGHGPVRSTGGLSGRVYGQLQAAGPTATSTKGELRLEDDSNISDEA